MTTFCLEEIGAKDPGMNYPGNESLKKKVCWIVFLLVVLTNWSKEHRKDA